MLNLQRKHLLWSMLAVAALASGIVVADPTGPADPATATTTAPGAPGADGNTDQPSAEGSAAATETNAANAANTAAEADAAPVAQPAPPPVPLPYPIREFAAKQNYQAKILRPRDLTASPAQQIADVKLQIQRLFNMERDLNHKSQCHERAEVWSYDIYRQTGYNLMKVMMFYTPRFRSTFTHDGDPYEWMYHTAPVIYADFNDGNGAVPYVLDSEFAKGPLTLNDWSAYFLIDEVQPGNNTGLKPRYDSAIGRYLAPPEARCQLIGNFRDFAVPDLRWDTNTAWCMTRIYPMYYMSPADVASMDCIPGDDSDYSAGLLDNGFWHPAKGAKVLERFTSGRLAGKYKYTCAKTVLTSFRKHDLDVAYDHAHQR
jgi:hypothetical protein